MRVAAPAALALAILFTWLAVKEGRYDIAVIDAVLAAANAYLSYVQWFVFTIK